ncbi:Crp/Fnr family transcriptional regulator, partial [Planktotalea sp.]|uniref:Crp/Fnr family transcriptional regulator n=1 Tax=Planktotalea sp. TaxID=2029877 RepID=UPI003C7520EA
MHHALSSIFEHGTEVKLAKGAALFRTDDRVTAMYLVCQGRVDLVRHVQSGERMVLHRASAGTVLAEASAYSKRYHCDGIADSQSTLRRISTADFLDKLNANRDLSQLWAAHLARILQRSRMNAEIRTLRRVSDRLDAWLELGN